MSQERVRAKQMDFSDGTITGGGYTERPDSYKAAVGRRDVIRIMTNPQRVYGANIRAAEGSQQGGFFAYSLGEIEDIEAYLQNNDEQAHARLKAACPLFARGYTIASKFVVMLYWAGSLDRSNKFKAQGTVLPWIFGGDKYNVLHTLSSTLPDSKQGKGKKVPFRAVELIVDCNDKQFQKMTFAMVSQPSQFRSSLDEAKAAMADYLNDPNNMESGSSLIDDLIRPDSKQSLNRSLDRIEGKGDTGAEDADGFNDAEPDQPAPRPAARPKVQVSKGPAVPAKAVAPRAGAAPAAKPQPKAAPGKVTVRKPVAKPAPVEENYEQADEAPAEETEPAADVEDTSDEALAEDLDNILQEE